MCPVQTNASDLKNLSQLLSSRSNNFIFCFRITNLLINHLAALSLEAAIHRCRDDFSLLKAKKVPRKTSLAESVFNDNIEALSW